METKVVCPHCGRQYSVRADKLGKRAKCAGCGNPFTLEVFETRKTRPADPLSDLASAASEAPIPQRTQMNFGTQVKKASTDKNNRKRYFIIGGVAVAVIAIVVIVLASKKKQIPVKQTSEKPVAKEVIKPSPEPVAKAPAAETKPAVVEKQTVAATKPVEKRVVRVTDMQQDEGKKSIIVQVQANFSGKVEGKAVFWERKLVEEKPVKGEAISRLTKTAVVEAGKLYEMEFKYPDKAWIFGAGDIEVKEIAP